MPWFVDAMQQRIDNVLNNGLFRSFTILGAGGAQHVSATVINVLLDLMAMQNIPDEGFEEIHLISFGDIGELDVGVLDRLVEESKNLSKLTVSYMLDELTEDNR